MRQSPARPLLALAVAAMGAVDLASAILSHPPDRLLALRRLVPTEVLDTSRTFTLLAGVLLLLAANGLRSGKRRAFIAAMFLCAVSVPVNLLKAFDLEEATSATALMFLLGVNAHAFPVKSRGLSLRTLRGPAVVILLSIAVYAIGGSSLVALLYSPHDASLGRATQEALHQLFGIGSPAFDVAQARHGVRWFLGSISVVGITALAGLVLALLQPARHLGAHRAAAARVRDLVATYGDSSVAWFATDEDTDWFFSANGRAVIAYRFEADVLLAIGDPIGPPEEIPSLLDAFERFCREHDWAFAFYQSRPEHLAQYRARGWRSVHIGEDPVLWTDRFSPDGPARASLRRVVRRTEKSGVVARHFVPGGTAYDPAHDPDRLLDQLREISQAWLREKTGGEKGFCMGRFDPSTLAQAWLAVAWHPQTGRVEAFCTWTPIPARRGWALDLMRRRPDSLPGAVELLVTSSVEVAKASGDAMLSLSLSALVKVDGTTGEIESAAADDPARAFLIERLRRFYDFEGLFRWKRKFDPAFEDRYLVFGDPLALPRIAFALARVQSPGGLMAYLRRPRPAPAGLGNGAPHAGAPGIAGSAGA